MKLDKINIQRITALLTFIICIMIMYWGEKNPAKWEYVIASLAFYYFGYLSRRPHPDEKSFIVWLKILILRLRIAILKKNLKPYTTLNSIRHQKYKAIRQTVKSWRSELKQLKKELNELVK